jgi:hypothetical protein
MSEIAMWFLFFFDSRQVLMIFTKKPNPISAPRVAPFVIPEPEQDISVDRLRFLAGFSKVVEKASGFCSSPEAQLETRSEINAQV